jgi:hypothetical protein
VYSFNIAGLVAPNAQAALRPSPVMVRGTEHPYTVEEATFVNDVMRTFADMTGGRAVVNTGDPAREVPGILQELGAYYSLAYRAAYSIADGKGHRLQIRVDRPGVTVLPSERILTSEKPRAVSKAAPSPLLRAVSDIVPASDLPMAVSVAPFDKAVLTILRVRRPAPSEAGIDEIQVLAKVFTPEGKQVASFRQNAKLKLRETSDEAQLDILTPILVKPGRYNVRFSARSTALDRTGSVYADVEVPNFSKDRLSLSGVLVSADPAAIIAPKDAFVNFVPALPTSARAFAPTDRVSAFLRVYQGDKNKVPVGVSVRVVDAQGADVATKTERLPADAFTAIPGVDVTFDVPLRLLTPGSYLLSITATLDAKTSSRRDVRFSVR